MLKSVRKHNVSFAPIKLSEHLKNQMPAWCHLGAPPNTYHKTKDNCLKDIHQVTSVKDLRNAARKLTNLDTHTAKATCLCADCIKNRLAGCKNPDKCARAAKRILDNLTPLFNPNTSPKKDDLTLTHRRIEKNRRVRSQQNGEIIFDPSVTAKSNISECFRIFVS
ncbi:hypothetical protein P692DRAFT_20715959, partial [Suillus brevipes Sb2]